MPDDFESLVMPIEFKLVSPLQALNDRSWEDS